MAEPQSKADLLALGYKGYTGWGDENAVMADFRATGGSGKFEAGSGGQSNQNLAQSVVENQKMLQQAQQPAIQSLQAQTPINEQRFAGQRQELAGKEESMQTRYSNLLSDIKGQGEQQLNKATSTQAQELARRGIAPGGTFYEQEIQGAQQPIQQATQGFTRDVALAQSDEARQLNTLGQQVNVNEQQAQQDISAAIAAIQSATSTKAIDMAMQQLVQAQQAQQFAQSQAQQASQFQQGFGLQQQQFGVDQALAQYQLDKPYYKPTTGGASGAVDWGSLWDEFNQ